MTGDQIRPRHSADEDPRPSGFLEVLIQRRWSFLGPFFALGLLGYTAANVLPLQYRSSAFIIVEQQKVPEQYVTPNVLMNLQKRLDSMTQQILSRTRLQRFIEDFGLYASERKRAPMDDVIDLMRRRTTIEIVQTTGRQAELTGFRIYFSDPDAYVAQRVTNELTSLFIEQDARDRTSQSQRTTAFLESQLAEAQKELATEEEKVREYKLKHLDELPTQQEGKFRILSSLEAQLQASTSALDRAEQQRIYLESMRSQQEALKNLAVPAPAAAATAPAEGDVAAANAGVAAPTLEIAQSTLADLWQQMRALTAKFTDKHPAIARLRKEIADWEAAVQRLSNERMAGAEIESRLRAVLAEIENERRESSDLRSRISEVQGHLSNVPVREQELGELTRQHESAKKNFESLLQKKLNSELASNLEERQGGERFRLLDPATLPKKPQGREKIVIAGWLIAMAAGAGLTLLREILDKTLHRPADLAAYEHIQVLARIPTFRSRRQERVRRFHRKLEVIGVSAMVLVSLASGAHTYLER